MNQHRVYLNMILFSIVTLAFLAGCSPVKFDRETLVSKAGVDIAPVVPEGPAKPEVPVCEIRESDYEINTQVYSFEITSSTNLGFGFNIANGFFKAFSANFKASKGRMDLGMDMVDLLQPTEAIANAEGMAVSKENQFNFDVNIYQFNIDVGHFSKTPLATLTDQALNDAFSKIQKRLKTLGLSWNSRVTGVIDANHVVMPAGLLAGLKVGDQFKIYGVNNVWDGAPCSSRLIISEKVSETPLSLGKVVQMNMNAAILEVDPSSISKIRQGDLIEISKLVAGSNPKVARTLGRSIHIGKVESQKLMFGDKEVDLTVYMRNQMGPLVEKYGYYIKL